MQINCTTRYTSRFVGEQEIDSCIADYRDLLCSVQKGRAEDQGYLGWFTVSKECLTRVKAEAERIRELADVMIVIGIGGSNRAAVAVLQALKRRIKSTTTLFFAGDTLSPTRLEDALNCIETKSVVLNVIAKDFNTVEPGVTFRMLRSALQKKYGDSYSQRIVATGSDGEGQLHELANNQGYAFLPFPKEIGGRFSALSEVALFPLAVAGVDVDALIAGASTMERKLKSLPPEENPAMRYAVLRNLIRKRGITIESLVVFEPDLQDFIRWWVQLFAETEGKTGDVLFPVGFNYSEDLHAVGQYVQEGPRVLLETFLNFQYTQNERVIEPSPQEDGFSYLDGKRFQELTTTVYQAALKAHTEGGVPCVELSCDEPLSTASIGSLFYFFLFSAYCSSVLLGVNPFDQNGVEAYKRAMYHDLGKQGY